MEIVPCIWNSSNVITKTSLNLWCPFSLIFSCVANLCLTLCVFPFPWMFPSELTPSPYLLLNFVDNDNEAVTVLPLQIPNGQLTLMTHNLSHGSAKVFWRAKSSYEVHPTKYRRNHISLCVSLWVNPSKNWICLYEFSNMSVVSMHNAVARPFKVLSFSAQIGFMNVFLSLRHNRLLHAWRSITPKTTGVQLVDLALQ